MAVMARALRTQSNRSFLRSAGLLLPVMLAFSPVVAQDRSACASIVTVDAIRSELILDATKAPLAEVWGCLPTLVKTHPQTIRLTVDLGQSEHRVDVTLHYPEVLRGRDIELVLRGQNAILSGAVRLTGWSPYKARPGDAPIETETGTEILEVAIPKDLATKMRVGLNRDHASRPETAPPELVVDGKVITLSRWPRQGFAQVAGYDEKERTINIAGEAEGIREPSNIVAQGFAFYDWADFRRNARVEKVGNGQTTIRISGPWPKYGVKVGARITLQGNAAWTKEKIGTYALLANRDVIVFSHPSTPNKIELTSTASALEFEGARNVQIEGVSFESFRGVALKLVGAEIKITRIIARNIGLNAISVSGVNNKIEDSLIHDTGDTSVYMTGGDRRLLAPGNSSVVRTKIYRFGRLAWSDVAAIRIDGVGQIVEDNILRDGPNAGVLFFGNDHRIEDNDISAVAKLTSDVGAIYTGRDWTGRGNIVERNFIYDVHGVGGHGATALYLDDQASGVSLRDNIVWNVHRGVLLGGGRDNVVTRNVFIRTKECMVFDARGTTWQRPSTQPGGVLWNRLHAVPYREEPYLSRYPKLEGLLEAAPGYPVGNRVVENLGVDCKWHITPEARKWSEVGRNTVAPGLNIFKDVVEQPQRGDVKIDWNSVVPNLK